MKFSKPYWIGILVVLVAAEVVVFTSKRAPKPIKVGVLHSLTGNMATSERPMVDALQFAFDEINAAGGLLGRPVQPVVADCRSDADFCAREAERLISEEHVSALFGCWTSACRKAVKPVVERYHHLLFYPLQYEGMELSPNIVYVGSAPNQQIVPAIRWSLDNLGKTYYLVGSDYVFPRTANLIIKDLILSQGGKILGERYLPLGSNDVAPVIDDLVKLHPAVVLNTINGDSNEAFFKAFHQAGLSARTMPVFSFSLAEAGFSRLPDIAGHYAAWSYFQSLPNEVNQAFVTAFKQRYGADRTIGDPMESSYAAVQLWKQAVLSAHSDKADVVNNAVSWQSLRSPNGIVVVGANTRHTWKTARIGRVRADGQFDIVWESSRLIAPEPFPGYRTREQWARMLKREGQP
ncbi:MAG: urea ABC transporter substrate-binding protein [Gallionellaceae bacterium]|nr:urea ABC transporter substrate-binding protein [Gallionellaceae bacterium]